MTLEIDELYASPSLIGTKPTGIAWSPDSRRFAFLWNDQGEERRSVWIGSIGDSKPEQLTHQDQESPGETKSVSEVLWLDENSVAYSVDDVLLKRVIGTTESSELARGEGLRNLTRSPDGGKLVFTSSEGLRLLDLTTENAEASVLFVRRDPDIRISDLQWSDDSSLLAFMQTDSRTLPEREIHYETRDGHQVLSVRRAFPGEETARFQIGLVEIASGAVRFIDRPDDRDYIWNYGLSTDSKRLFLNSSDRLVKHHRVDVYDLESGGRRVFYQEHDPKHLRPDWQVAWARDDEGLIILTDRDGFLHLYHQADAEANPRALTRGDWEIASFHVDVHRGWVYFLSNRSQLADRQLYRVRFAGGEIEQMTPEARGTHVPVFSPDMQTAVSLYSNDLTPHDLLVLDFDSRTAKPITNSPLPAFYQQQWAQVEYVEFPSRVDGVNLVGRLSLPPDFDPGRRYPLIVGSVYSDSVLNQWGGRQSHPTWGLDQALVAQGYLLLNVNVRGSWGQGREHNQGLRHGYGIADIEDLHSGVEFLVREGYADPERVGIWGSSYGGLMTMMSLFKKPGVYAAGIAGAPATNVAHAYPGQMWVMGEAVGGDQPGRYQSQSPLFHSAGLVDPLMIIHGTRDQVVLYSDTLAVVQDLIDREQLFELVTLPGVGHGWDAEAPEVRRFAFNKMVEFFNRHLNPGLAAE